MEKVKKYSDFITEGMWKSGVERAKNNVDRLEVSKFFKRPEIHQIKDYPEYYLEFVDKSKHAWYAANALLIYHYPNEEFVAEYINYDPNIEEESEFDPCMDYWEDYYLEGNDEEDSLLHSDEFQQSLWETVVEVYYS